jgi:hypothetical protein
MLLSKTTLAFILAAVIYAPSTFANTCETVCTSSADNNKCGKEHDAAMLIRLNPQPDPNPQTKLLVATTIATRYEVTGHFDSKKIVTSAKGGSGHFLFDIYFGGGHSATYKISAQDGACEFDIPGGATLISGSAIYSPMG